MSQHCESRAFSVLASCNTLASQHFFWSSSKLLRRLRGVVRLQAPVKAHSSRSQPVAPSGGNPTKLSKAVTFSEEPPAGKEPARAGGRGDDGLPPVRPSFPDITPEEDLALAVKRIASKRSDEGIVHFGSGEEDKATATLAAWKLLEAVGPELFAREHRAGQIAESQSAELQPVHGDAARDPGLGDAVHQNRVERPQRAAVALRPMLLRLTEVYLELDRRVRRFV